MYTIYVLTAASIKLFVRNRQALFFSMFMPLLILFIFGSMDFDRPEHIHIGLVTHSPSEATKDLISHLKSISAVSLDEGSFESEMDELKHGQRAAVVDVPDDLLSHGDGQRELKVYTNAGRPIESQSALTFLNMFADKAALGRANITPFFTIKQESLSVHNYRYIEFLLPGIMAMAVMQMSVFSVAFLFTQYKEKGILKRVLATPVRPFQFVTANIITRLCVALAQAAIFVFIGGKVFHTGVAGSYWLLAATIILGSLAFIGMGFTISGISKNVDAVPVLANVLVFPMMFLGNVFFSIGNTPPWLQAIAKVLPLTVFSNVLHGVMTTGESLADMRSDFLGLVAWAVGLTILATLTFRFQGRESA